MEHLFSCNKSGSVLIWLKQNKQNFNMQLTPEKLYIIFSSVREKNKVRDKHRRQADWKNGTHSCNTLRFLEHSGQPGCSCKPVVLAGKRTNKKPKDTQEIC